MSRCKAANGDSVYPEQLERCGSNPNSRVSPYAQPGQLPVLAYLELTPMCNSICLGCSNSYYLANHYNYAWHAPMDWSEWEIILQKLESPTMRVNLTGGEPTLHPEFEAIVAAIDNRGIPFVVFSNGRWRSPQRVVSLLASTLTFQGFLISLHGASPKTHETFTQTPGSFTEVTRNIRLAVQAGLMVSTSTVITRANCHELDEIAYLSRDLGGVQAVFNRYLVPQSCGNNDNHHAVSSQVPASVELRAAVTALEDVRQELDGSYRVGYGPCIPQCFVSSSSRGCLAGEASVAVDPWGNVKPCTDAMLTCGNLLSQSLDEIWWGNGMQQWRGMVPTDCQDCMALAACRMGCRAMALLSKDNRDPLIPRSIPLELAMQKDDGRQLASLSSI